MNIEQYNIKSINLFEIFSERKSMHGVHDQNFQHIMIGIKLVTPLKRLKTYIINATSLAFNMSWSY